MAGQNEVVVDLVAENTDLRRKLGESQQEIQRLKERAEQGTSSLAAGFRRSVSAVTSFIGAVTAATAVVGTFYTIGTKVRSTIDDIFSTGEQRAQAFIDALKGPIEQQLVGLNAEISALQGDLAALLNPDESSITKARIRLKSGFESDIASELTKLIKKRDDVQKQVDAALKSKDSEAIEERIEAEKDATEQIEASRLGGIKRIEAEEKLSLRRIQKERDDNIGNIFFKDSSTRKALDAELEKQQKAVREKAANDRKLAIREQVQQEKDGLQELVNQRLNDIDLITAKEKQALEEIERRKREAEERGFGRTIQFLLDAQVAQIRLNTQVERAMNMDRYFSEFRRELSNVTVAIEQLHGLVDAVRSTQRR